VPRALDWYLGLKGVDGQLTIERGPRYGSNVFEPRDEDLDAGAHGMFDAKAHARDPWSWLSMRRAPAALAAGALGALALVRRRHA
jgi:hypothetical protein